MEPMNKTVQFLQADNVSKSFCPNDAFAGYKICSTA